MKYKIGQILTSKEDIEVEKALSGKKVIIPKGSKVIIGADKLAHYIHNGMMQPLKDDTEITGYDCEGLAQYLFICLKKYLPLEDMMEDCEITQEKFCGEIQYALEEIL